MTVSITATAGSASANSYLSLAAADSIATTMLGTLAWSTATTDDRSRALITATRGLETLSWVGTRSTEVQALAWPRTGVYLDGQELDKTLVPEAVQYATFDLAEALLTRPALLKSDPGTSSLIPGVQNRDLRRLKLDALEIEWRREVSGASMSRVTPLTVLPHLATMLAGLTTSTSGTATTVPLVRS